MNVSNSALNESVICRRRDEEYILVNTLTSLLSIALNLGSCPVIIFMNVLVIVAIKTRRRLVHVQHTTGLLSGNRSGGGSSFTTVIHRTRNLLSVGCSAGGLLFLLQKDSFIYFSFHVLNRY